MHGSAVFYRGHGHDGRRGVVATRHFAPDVWKHWITPAMKDRFWRFFKGSVVKSDGSLDGGLVDYTDYTVHSSLITMVITVQWFISLIIPLNSSDFGGWLFGLVFHDV